MSDSAYITRKIFMKGYLVPLFVLPLLTTCNQKATHSLVQEQPMVPKFKDVYAVYITRKMEETKAFYEKWFGFTTLFNSSWFLILASPGEHPQTLAFLNEVWPHSPKPPRFPAYNQSGSYLTIQVSDVDPLYHSLKTEGLSIHYELTNEPWGQRRFSVIDPSGIFIDIVQDIDPQPGYWDSYIRN
ncbi:MAG: VOC family protein [Stenomitos rutilans HA7619-LM2]|jgi:catechol 2,3-dioxygenase-like lactoylglutathione lyase family enzyme|nr:VOC family protein [Stenomitos rutilans HA7619-LM2]